MTIFDVKRFATDALNRKHYILRDDSKQEFCMEKLW